MFITPTGEQPGGREKQELRQFGVVSLASRAIGVHLGSHYAYSHSSGQQLLATQGLAGVHQPTPRQSRTVS